MTNDTVPVRVRVRDSAGAYVATIGRCRASSTADAETAVRHAGQRAKIDALLAELHRVTGKVHTLKYADAIAKRNGYGECVDFCDGRGLRYVIGALTRTLQFKIKNA